MPEDGRKEMGRRPKRSEVALVNNTSKGLDAYAEQWDINSYYLGHRIKRERLNRFR